MDKETNLTKIFDIIDELLAAAAGNGIPMPLHVARAKSKELYNLIQQYKKALKGNGQYEYKILHNPTEGKLNMLAKENWRLITVTVNRGNYDHAYLERKKSV